jgi:MoaA/NifB/PqqE/SkfB family radical SAM enzyme
MRCSYCRLRDSKLEEPELDVEGWKRAFSELDELGCSFHLILGNETLAVPGIVEFVSWLKERTPYALYSSCSPGLYDKLKRPLVEAGLKNFSCGCDTLDFSQLNNLGDMGVKSRRAYYALQEMKALGVPDYQGTLTISRVTLGSIFSTMQKLTDAGIWIGCNLIHWNKGGGFDFFPLESEIPEFLFRPEDKNWYDETMLMIKEAVVAGQLKVQNPPEYFDDAIKYGRDMSWHCSLPLIYSVDSDGRMRACGYRRGTRSPKFSIFDVRANFQEFQEANWLDREECPGCFWSYWWMAEHFVRTEQREFGLSVFQDHNSRYYFEGER